MIPGRIESDIDIELNDLPDQVADALIVWRTASLEREKVEALLYIQFKGEDDGRTSSYIEAMIKSNGERYTAVLSELKAEAEYKRLNERLMSVKKKASLRTAF